MSLIGCHSLTTSFSQVCLKQFGLNGFLSGRLWAAFLHWNQLSLYQKGLRWETRSAGVNKAWLESARVHPAGFFFFFFSLMTHTSRIHAASGCFRNKLTSPEGWPSIDATDSALGIYAVRLIIKEPWHKMNVNTHIYLSHSMFFSLIHFPFLLPESLLREAKQPPDLHTDKCLKPTSTSCYKRVRQLLIRHMRMFPYISSVESIIH